ncbi:MAG TPA: recombinase family protein [Opitutaceae bacterium]|nr:recombinase family protein [Opitutaceae bacterium]
MKEKSSELVRVAAYVRVSTTEQSLDVQERDLVKYCTTRGWEPVIYRDVQSGADASRPGLEAMMEAVRRREVAAIIAVKLDRIGRSLVHLAVLVGELARLHVPLVCTSQGIDTSADNPVGEIQRGKSQGVTTVLLTEGLVAAG